MCVMWPEHWWKMDVALLAQTGNGIIQAIGRLCDLILQLNLLLWACVKRIACIGKSAVICLGRWCPWGQRVTKRDLQEWHFASSCYRCDVGRGRVKVGEGGVLAGLVSEWCDITSRYILCCRMHRLVLPYQSGAKGNRSSDLTFSSLHRLFFNMQTHLFCQAIINSPPLAVPKTPDPSKNQRGSIQQYMEPLLILTEFCIGHHQVPVYFLWPDLQLASRSNV